jgi:TnpA family transposase
VRTRRLAFLGAVATRQALAEIGRVHKTVHILRTLDDEEYRRRMGRELNKGEASHELSRFLCFGKEGALRGAGVRRSAAHL